MFKVQITAINPSTPPRPYGGTSSLIPPTLAVGGDRPIDATISISSTETVYTGADQDLIAQWLTDQYGMDGKRVGDDPSVRDVVAALTSATWLEWEILEGKEILDLPEPELPAGAIA